MTGDGRRGPFPVVRCPSSVTCMKILALSDEVVDLIYSPALKERFGFVDFVVGCGDLPFFYLEFVVTALGKPVFYVHGNHDRPSQFLSDGRIISAAEGCEPIEGRVVRAPDAHGPLLLAGLGGSLRYNADAVHQYTQSQMHRRVLALAPQLFLNRVSHGRFLDILITHAPPRGIHDQPDLAHTGLDAFRSFMERYRPKFLLHGHAHVYRNDIVTATRFHETQVINVYPYRLIDTEQRYV